MSSNLTVDDLLLYSRCPMKLFFKKVVPLDRHSTSFAWAVKDAMRGACYSFLSMLESEGYGPTLKARSMSILMSKLRAITKPASARGGGAARNTYERKLNEAEARFDTFMDDMIFMEPNIVGSPYIYHIVCGKRLFMGHIDAVLERNGVHDLVTFDFGTRDPPAELMDNSPQLTATLIGYREVAPQGTRYRLIYNWVPRFYVEVHRSNGQCNAVRRELGELALVATNAVEEGRWWRSKGYWCERCSIVDMCNDISNHIPEVADSE